MGRLNYLSFDNGDVKVYTSYYSLKSTSDSFSYPDNTPVIPIDDDEMDHLPELYHSDQDDDILDVPFQMIQT